MSRAKTKNQEAENDHIPELPCNGTILRRRLCDVDRWTCRHLGGTAIRVDRGHKGHVAIRIGGEVSFLSPDETMALIEFLAGPEEGWR